MRLPQTVEKVPLGLFRRTSQLRARLGGYAANPHTCWDRSVFCLGIAEAKNGFQKPASRANSFFSTSWSRCKMRLPVYILKKYRYYSKATPHN